MGLFQSDNIWKRQARAKKQAENPRTPYEQWKHQMTSDGLWLAGGLVIVVLYLQAMGSGAVELTLTAMVVVAVVTLYCCFTAVQLGKRWRERPEKTTSAKGSGGKKHKKKK